MRKMLLVFGATLVLAGAAFGTLGSVVASWPAPADYPIALARPGNPTYLWVYCNTGPYNIWRTNANTGSVYSSYVSPRGHETKGLTYRWGGYLYVGDYATDSCYVCDYANGSVHYSFELGHNLSGGLALECGRGGINPQALYSSDIGSRYVYRQDYDNGSIYSSFLTQPCAVWDLAWDYNNNLVWGGGLVYFDDPYVYGYTTSGSLAASFPSPALYPIGMCYYGEYLWIGTTTGSHRIWKVHCPGGLDRGTNVTPTSAGKIKALFH